MTLLKPPTYLSLDEGASARLRPQNDLVHEFLVLIILSLEIFMHIQHAPASREANLLNEFHFKTRNIFCLVFSFAWLASKTDLSRLVKILDSVIFKASISRPRAGHQL